jgi:hypothetical protein
MKEKIIEGGPDGLQITIWENVSLVTVSKTYSSYAELFDEVIKTESFNSKPLTQAEIDWLRSKINVVAKYFE